MFSIGICDDDIHMLAYLEKLCQKILPECKVVMYQTGSELLKSQTNFDMILVDIKMEGPDGLETVRKLRGNTTDGVHAGLPLFLSPPMMTMYLRLSIYSLFSIY